MTRLFDGTFDFSFDAESNTMEIAFGADESRMKFDFKLNKDGEPYYVVHTGQAEEDDFARAFAIARDYAKQLKLPIAA